MRKDQKMIKEVKIVQCDICGKTEEVKEHDSKGKIVLPKRWEKSNCSENVHICPKCSARLGDRLWPGGPE